MRSDVAPSHVKSVVSARMASAGLDSWFLLLLLLPFCRSLVLKRMIRAGEALSRLPHSPEAMKLRARGKAAGRKRLVGWCPVRRDMLAR